MKKKWPLCFAVRNKAPSVIARPIEKPLWLAKVVTTYMNFRSERLTTVNKQFNYKGYLTSPQR